MVTSLPGASYRSILRPLIKGHGLDERIGAIIGIALGMMLTFARFRCCFLSQLISLRIRAAVPCDVSHHRGHLHNLPQGALQSCFLSCVSKVHESLLVPLVLLPDATVSIDCGRVDLKISDHRSVDVS